MQNKESITIPNSETPLSVITITFSQKKDFIWASKTVYSSKFMVWQKPQHLEFQLLVLSNTLLWSQKMRLHQTRWLTWYHVAAKVRENFHSFFFNFYKKNRPKTIVD